MGGRKVVFVAAGVLVDAEGRILLARRPEGKSMAGLWEFPGGKMEAGESPEDALIRELREELSIDVQTSDLEPLTFVSHAYPDFHLVMPVFLCRRWAGQVVALEHEGLAWVAAERLSDYSMPAADLPILAAIKVKL
jgi:8-oxo-dGTP diphosphatase